jgi:hypothetical protein
MPDQALLMVETVPSTYRRLLRVSKPKLQVHIFDAVLIDAQKV